MGHNLFSVKKNSWNAALKGIQRGKDCSDTPDRLDNFLPAAGSHARHTATHTSNSYSNSTATHTQMFATAQKKYTSNSSSNTVHQQEIKKSTATN
jgi:hypothetical protein